MKKVSSLASKMPDFPISEFDAAKASLLIDLRVAKDQHESAWGIDRLVMLVDTDLRVKVWAQLERVWAAQQARDIERMAKAVGGMKKAYQAMERWAEENNVQRVPDVSAVEWKMQDGSVMVVVRSVNDAVAYQQFRPDIANRHVWCMEEIELLMASPVLQEMIKLKGLMPGSRMTRIEPAPGKGGATGFDDFPDSDIDLSGDYAKLFDTSQYDKRQMATKGANHA